MSWPKNEGESPYAATEAMIDAIIREEDLYKILGASRTSSPSDLRRCYLERSKLCHPDKNPTHPSSTSAFQRLAFAFEILKSPSARRTYDLASTPPPRSLRTSNNTTTSTPSSEHPTSRQGPFLFTNPDNPNGNEDQTFRRAVEAVLHEFITGDFTLVRRSLERLNRRYPHLISEEVVLTVERSFVRIRELVLTTRTYALLVYIELGRIHRVQKRLMGLGYFDVLGRVRLTVHLVRVTLAVPMRVDRALKAKEEKDWRAKTAGLQAAGLPLPDETRRAAGILNERMSKVLEFIVGEAGRDEGADEAWDARMRRESENATKKG
ncbi:DnaJ-domain-containing protein [Xylona heveae TC161]|uniref:DnaJ-domain-containing protein n=1 Tax=Xylona heveae (strain CBS 132557 / TC161) TaxID=1328760 RepID=A0A165HAS0_XYLHT|nr:DnaJ-domain-containing protein [Xylona heveae TC161]KZF23225.1 DnaJ-domain-containing protein [Xylona heveae TC161]